MIYTDNHPMPDTVAELQTELRAERASHNETHDYVLRLEAMLKEAEDEREEWRIKAENLQGDLASRCICDAYR